MGRYDNILKVNGDIQYKILYATIAVANEDNERNRLLRFRIALMMQKMSTSEISLAEKLVQEDFDLTDQTAEE